MKKGILAGKHKLSGVRAMFMGKEQIQDIHDATLEVLEQRGLAICCPQALELMAEIGADVDFDTQMVRIPPYLVEEAVNSAPAQVLLAGRYPQYDVLLGGGGVHYTTFGAGARVIDPETNRYYESTRQDVANTALLCDALDNVAIYSSAVVARDMPHDLAELYEAEAFLTNTAKHCQHLHLSSGLGARKFIEMGILISGSQEKFRKRPSVSAQVCPVAPLQLQKGTCELIMEAAAAGMPINVLSMGMAGATTPVTLAGALVVHNAEVLGSLVLHQAVAKGAPFIYGSSTTTFDLYMLTAPVGSPEMALISAAVAELAKFYLLPSYVSGT